MCYINFSISVHSITLGHPRNSSFEPKPDLPPRRPVNPTHGYENLPEKAESLPPREPIGEGYVNLPPKSRSTSDPPQLPPRSPRQNGLGYENVPSSSRGLGPPTSSGYQNIPSQGNWSSSLQTTLPKINNVAIAVKSLMVMSGHFGLAE